MKVIQHKKVSLTTESFQIATNMKVKSVSLQGKNRIGYILLDVNVCLKVAMVRFD